MILKLFLIFLLTTGICFTEKAATLPSPKVYALVIGVSTYADGTLSNACPGAKKFLSLITNAYPNAVISFLLESNATLANAEQFLSQDMSHASPGSLLIFYFAGHGMTYLGESQLLLSGATQSSPWGYTLQIGEVLKAVLEAKQCAGMLYLDCCFSGDRPTEVTIPDEINQSSGTVRFIDSRAFLLASSYLTEQSISGLFTDALVKVLQHARTVGNCLTPTELADQVKSIVYTNSHNFMNSELVFGDNFKQCVLQLNSPSCLLIFRFPNGCKYPAHFFINNEEAPIYNPEQRIYNITVPKAALNIRIEMSDMTVFSKNFLANDLASDELFVDVPLIGDNANFDTAFLSDSEALCAEATESYGASKNKISDLYAKAIIASHTYTPNRDVANLIAKLAIYGNESPVYRLASGISDQNNNSDLSAAAHAQEYGKVDTLLESAGKYNLAAYVNTIAANNLIQSDKDAYQYNLYKAAINYKVGGSDQQSQIAILRLSVSQINPSQRVSLQNVISASPEVIKQSSAAIINSKYQWKYMGAAAMPRQE